MKSGRFREITDEMIGRDDRVCNCASRVADMIIAGEEAGAKSPRRKPKKVLKKVSADKKAGRGTEGKGEPGLE